MVKLQGQGGAEGRQLPFKKFKAKKIERSILTKQM